ncbi:RHAG [Symbiodinium pilosum]|uniref:RHAG protein n=1 Tax=Symbiodinium pilosum TaxID=2952 RepID=A0A812WB95_SYMPI|nr:RHAG [Symbiodinium pilosum]
MPAALAVAFAAALQELSYAKFPAGGSIALSVIVMPEASKLGWSFLLQPGLLSTCLLVIYGTLLNNLQETRLYPRHWPWQRADGPVLLPHSEHRGHSERDLCRQWSDAERRPFSTTSNTQVGMLMVASQMAFIIFLLLAEFDREDVDSKTRFDHVAGLSMLTLVGLGLMRAFLKAYGLGALGFCILITCLAIQWSIMLESILLQRVPRIGLDSLVSGYLAAATTLVSFGALIGKVSLRQILIALLIELPCYRLHRALMQTNSHLLHVRDGGLEIHLFGAFFGYSAARVLGPCEMDWLNQSSYVLDLLSLVGTLCFWVCFPSIDSLGAQTQHAHITMVLALLGSTVAAFAIDSFCHSGKLEVASIRAAVLAGGIATTAVADVIEPGLALMVGCASGTASVLGLRFLSNTSVDTCGVLSAHGIPAFLYAGVPMLQIGSGPRSPAFELCSCLLTALLSGTCCGYLLRRVRTSESQEHAFSDETSWVCAKDVPRGSVNL